MKAGLEDGFLSGAAGLLLTCVRQLGCWVILVGDFVYIAGKDWNYVIGGSSPWVVSYDLKLQGDIGTIVYHLADSGPGKYDKTEIITFGRANNKLLIIDSKEILAEWEEPPGDSAFETGVFPRWLSLVKDKPGWYVEGLMTSGPPDESWWKIDFSRKTTS